MLLAAFTGLRWGELLALRRRHLDLSDGIVKVRGSVGEVGGRLIEGPPKSAAGRRDVAIPEAIVSELRAHLDEWSEEGQDGRVFVGPQGATPKRGNFQPAGADGEDGHNSARAALIYQHASKDRERAIRAAISARIEAVRAQAKDTIGTWAPEATGVGAGARAAADGLTRAAARTSG